MFSFIFLQHSLIRVNLERQTRSTQSQVVREFRDAAQLGSRANFSKQASALWVMKQRLQRQLLIQQDVFEDGLFIVDGFPMPICLFPRAKWCQFFKGEADYGYYAAKGATVLGRQVGLESLQML